MLASIPYVSSGSWRQALQVIQLCLIFGSAYSGITDIIKDIKQPDFLWDVVSGSLILVLFTSSYWRTVYAKTKTDWSDTSTLRPQLHGMGK